MWRAAFHLATHANAALGGRLNSIPFPAVGKDFARAEWVFYPLSKTGRRIRSTPDEWLSVLKEIGCQRAWFGYWDHSVGIWAVGNDFVQYYTVRTEKREDGRSRISVDFEQVMSEGVRLIAPFSEAQERLQDALKELLRYAIEIRHEAHIDRLAEALNYIAHEPEDTRDTDDLFPPGIYPVENLHLCAAALKADVIGTGGMGSWMDFRLSKDPGFREKTVAFLHALYPAYTTASFCPFEIAESEA